jgi:hypothetical protein
MIKLYIVNLTSLAKKDRISQPNTSSLVKTK